METYEGWCACLNKLVQLIITCAREGSVVALYILLLAYVNNIIANRQCCGFMRQVSGKYAGMIIYADDVLTFASFTDHR